MHPKTTNTDAPSTKVRTLTQRTRTPGEAALAVHAPHQLLPQQAQRAELHGQHGRGRRHDRLQALASRPLCLPPSSWPRHAERVGAGSQFTCFTDTKMTSTDAAPAEPAAARGDSCEEPHSSAADPRALPPPLPPARGLRRPVLRGARHGHSAGCGPQALATRYSIYSLY